MLVRRVGRRVVGRRGLEPLTPCASCKCATNCANGPFAETLPPGQIRLGRGRTARRCPTAVQLDPVTQSTGTTTSSLSELGEHLRRVAEDGYTVLPNAIEPQLINEVDEALLRLERDLGSVPADNLFE